MQTATGIPVTVVYATPTATHERALRVPPGTTLREAVVMSGLLAQVPELSAVPPDSLDLGVFNRPRPADTAVRAGDRSSLPAADRGSEGSTPHPCRGAATARGSLSAIDATRRRV